MIDKRMIEELVEEHLGKGALFLVYSNVSAKNSIKIVIDGDEGVTIDDCINLSRYVEHQLDRDREDFELSVMSAGLDSPFILLRQYRKNLTRSIKVMLNNGEEIRGKLLNADNNNIVIQEEIVKLYKKNKKVLLGKKLEIPMNGIKQAKAIASF